MICRDGSALTRLHEDIISLATYPTAYTLAADVSTATPLLRLTRKQRSPSQHSNIGTPVGNINYASIAWRQEESKGDDIYAGCQPSIGCSRIFSMWACDIDRRGSVERDWEEGRKIDKGM